MIRSIVCYKTSDGQVFESEAKAKEHAENLLGEELDGLFQLAKLDITRHQQFKALLELLYHKKELAASIDSIYKLLHFTDEADLD